MNPHKLRRLFPRAPESFIKANSDPDDSGLHPTKQEQPEGKPLERITQRKDKSCTRFEITFKVYAVRPNDWDNPYTKVLQDLLRHAGILHDDAWNVLQGRIIPCKAYKKEEERTEIEIVQL